jgi:hypothetical protein
MSVVGKILRAMDVGSYKLTSVITEMSIPDKLIAARFFNDSGYWPYELASSGAFVSGDVNLELLEFLIDSTVPVVPKEIRILPSGLLENPGSLLVPYLGTSEKFVGYCRRWLEEIGECSANNREARDELLSFIHALNLAEETPGLEKRASELLMITREIKIVPSPRSNREGPMDPSLIWEFYKDTSLKSGFVKMIKHREAEIRFELSSASSSAAQSPMNSQRSSTPQFPLESPRSAISFTMPLSHGRQTSSSRLPPVEGMPPRSDSSSYRSTGVASSHTVPSPQARIPITWGPVSLRTDGRKFTVGKEGSKASGWVAEYVDPENPDEKLANVFVIIGKLTCFDCPGDMYHRKIFTGPVSVVEKNFLERIVGLTDDEQKFSKAANRVYRPYVHSAPRN